MLLRGADANRYLAKPDPARAGLLIFGQDAMRVAMKRQEAIRALIGPEGEAEMRLARMSAAELRRDPAMLADALKAVGFFAGPRVAFVEDATDGMKDVIATAMASWKPGDASLVVTAGNLAGKSALKTWFEKHPNAVCIGLYDDPPSREEIEAELKRAAITNIDPQAMAQLGELARALDPGDFRQMLEKIALYKWQDATPLRPEEVQALAPATIDTEVDDLLHAVAEGNARQVGPLMRRLEGQGVSAVTLCIGALRHFRSLQMVQADPGNGLVRAKIFGPRRDRMSRQARAWSTRALEGAIAHVLETDLVLRSSSKAPTLALMERCLLRIAMSRR